MDELAARAFLHERLGATAEITVMRPGEWSAAYSVRTKDAELVARFSAYDEDFEKDAYAARYESAALPIPPIIEWGPAGKGYYAVAARMPGVHIDTLDEAWDAACAAFAVRRAGRDARSRPLWSVGLRRVAR